MTKPLAALALWLAFAAPASASGLCDLALRLDGLIVAETGYTPAPACPDITMATLGAPGAQRSQAGAFYPATGRIELAPDLDLTTVIGQSFLLHELVHAAQHRSGRAGHCLAALEAEAYALQADYLMTHGEPREAAITRLLGGMITGC
jgi:hypothetical protein